jgi:glutamate 5-kinase
MKGVPYRQVLASVGQHSLMNIYEILFSKYDITVSQALLTKADLSQRSGYLNARNTLLSLLELRVLCIVNENDVVAVDEIQEARFGDNDNLSAMVANLVDADLLMILTDIDGLYTGDPRHDPDARLIPRVENIDEGIDKMAADTSSRYGTGGMATKIQAARLAVTSGVTVVIAGGRETDVITRLAGGQPIGTIFPAKNSRLESRARWILSGLSVRGKLIVDTGAARAIKEQNRSLLAAGIKGAQGKFQRGDIVNIFDPEGKRIGCGITNYDAEEIQAIMGARSAEISSRLGYDYGAEVIHRNNMVTF